MMRTAFQLRAVRYAGTDRPDISIFGFDFGCNLLLQSTISTRVVGQFSIALANVVSGALFFCLKQKATLPAAWHVCRKKNGQAIAGSPLSIRAKEEIIRSIPVLVYLAIRLQ
jgi:hypothetical protein